MLRIADGKRHDLFDHAWILPKRRRELIKHRIGLENTYFHK
jgi:hypothetical protein